MRLRIRALRDAQNCDGETLASRAGISRSYLSEIETGKKPANTYRLEAIAKALGVTVPDLIENTDEIPALAGLIEDFCSLPHDLQQVAAAQLRSLRAALAREPEKVE